jgi:hypothetical protein
MKQKVFERAGFTKNAIMSNLTAIVDSVDHDRLCWRTGVQDFSPEGVINEILRTTGRMK